MKLLILIFFSSCSIQLHPIDTKKALTENILNIQYDDMKQCLYINIEGITVKTIKLK